MARRMRAYMSWAVLAVALSALIMVSAPDLAHAAGQNYIYVYPNSAVRVLVNGTYEAERPIGSFNTSIAVTFYPNFTVLTLRHEGTLPSANFTPPESPQGDESWQLGEGQGVPLFSGYVRSYGSLNLTSNGRVEELRLVSNSAYLNGSKSAGLNISEYESIQAIASPPEYEVVIWANASWYPALQVPEEGNSLQVPVGSLSGVTVKEYKVYVNSSYASVYIVLQVNGTPASINTSLGRVQAVLNAALTPGFLFARYNVSLNLTSRTGSLYVFVNASRSLLNEATMALGLASRASGGLTTSSGAGAYMGELTRIVNVTDEIASYVESNLRVVTPSTMFVNVSSQGESLSYALESAEFERAGATSPKQSLAAITYLVGNVSQILRQNGFVGPATLVSSLDGVQVTLVGVDGVVVKPSVTTIGNLTSVSVTVSGNSSATRTAETVGGVTAVAVVLVAVLFLARRH